MHQNSLFAYEQLKSKLSQKQSQVLNALIYLKQATCSEVASYMNVPHHTISGRFLELKKKGLVKEGDDKMINGRPNAILIPNL